jgi:hypothetical protein
VPLAVLVAVSVRIVAFSALMGACQAGTVGEVGQLRNVSAGVVYFTRNGLVGGDRRRGRSLGREQLHSGNSLSIAATSDSARKHKFNCRSRFGTLLSYGFGWGLSPRPKLPKNKCEIPFAGQFSWRVLQDLVAALPSRTSNQRHRM